MFSGHRPCVCTTENYLLCNCITKINILFKIDLGCNFFFLPSYLLSSQLLKIDKNFFFSENTTLLCEHTYKNSFSGNTLVFKDRQTFYWIFLLLPFTGINLIKCPCAQFMQNSSCGPCHFDPAHFTAILEYLILQVKQCFSILKSSIQLYLSHSNN